MTQKRRFEQTIEEMEGGKAPKVSILQSIPNDWGDPEEVIPDIDGGKLYECKKKRLEVLLPVLPQSQDPFKFIFCVQMYGRKRKNDPYFPLNSTPEAIGSSRLMVLMVRANAFSCLFLNSISVSIRPKDKVGNFFFVLTGRELDKSQKEQFEQSNVLDWNWNSPISWEGDHAYRKDLFLTAVKRKTQGKPTKKCFAFCVTFTIRSSHSSEVFSHTMEITPRSHHVEKKTVEKASAYITTIQCG